MSCQISESAKARIESHLANIYGQEIAEQFSPTVIALCEKHAQVSDTGPGNKWSENDAILISYGDTITKEPQKHLVTLRQLLKAQLKGVVSGVHILPFFPYTSDDGFSVVDYLQVDDRLGDW